MSIGLSAGPWSGFRSRSGSGFGAGIRTGFGTGSGSAESLGSGEVAPASSGPFGSACSGKDGGFGVVFRTAGPGEPFSPVTESPTYCVGEIRDARKSNSR